MARETGILVDWHDSRGFGFIRRPAGGKLYVHMKSIGKSVERPKAGDSLSYEVSRGSDGRPVAVNVHNHGTPKAQSAPAPAPSPDVASKPARPKPEPGLLSISTRVAAAAVILVLLANNIMLERFPIWVGLLYLIAGIASFVFYQADKRAAERREWREPERRLHLLHGKGTHHRPQRGGFLAGRVTPADGLAQFLQPVRHVDDRGAVLFQKPDR